jgi:hypothetical protein
MVIAKRRRWTRLFDWRLQAVAAVGFASFAILLNGCHSAALAALNLEPVDLPLPSVAGSVGPTTFQIGYSGVYEIVVSLTGIQNEQTQASAECGLGISLFPERYCGAIPPALNLTWRLQQLQRGGADPLSVLRTDSGVASGQARGGSFSYNLIERRLTAFAAQRGDVYSLVVGSHADLESLRRFRPRVRVHTTMMENENIILRYLFYDLGAWLAGALGAVTLVLAGVGWCRHRRQLG